jgi:hypothetical protein
MCVGGIDFASFYDFSVWYFLSFILLCIPLAHMILCCVVFYCVYRLLIWYCAVWYISKRQHTVSKLEFIFQVFQMVSITALWYQIQVKTTLTVTTSVMTVTTVKLLVIQHRLTQIKMASVIVVILLQIRIGNVKKNVYQSHFG